MEKVKFTQMKDGTQAEYEFLTAQEIDHTKGTADRLLDALRDLDEGLTGYQITRLGHSVQSASRAWRDGADIDWVVSALLHDVGDIFARWCARFSPVLRMIRQSSRHLINLWRRRNLQRNGANRSGLSDPIGAGVPTG